MRIVFLCVVITGCIAEWTVNLEYSLNNFSEVYPLGSIELRRSFDGNYTGSFRATSGSRLGERMSADPSSTYQILARSSTNPKEQMMSSTKTCLLLQSNLFHMFWVTIDAERQLVLALTVFPDVVAAGDKALDSKLDCTQLPTSTTAHPSAVVHVVTKGILPTPDTQQFVQMMERERRSRQHGAEADDRSFLGKYGLTFSRMLRQSKFVDLGDFNGRLVTGRIVLRVQDDLYIDVGLKFNAVCKVPAVNSEEYREGAVVLLRLHDPELSERFLGSDRDLTLLEADATLMRLLRSGSGKGGPQRSKGGERTGKPTSPSTETSPQIAADAAA
ncbi:hypothetical protein Q1695_000298 [Nippostrongylus brasiliensis]|nr:hypothetical protein Q1695_000298 [Nippostrongylus brasiliensis]